MRLVLSVMGSVLFGLFGLTAASDSFADSSNEGETLAASDFVQHYEAALATQSWSEVSPLIHDKASVVFSNGTVHKGKAAVRKAFEGNFARIQHEKYEMTNIHWLLESPESAAYMFDFFWSGIVEGKEVSGGGRGTAVLVFEDGRWLLLAEHLGYPEH